MGTGQSLLALAAMMLLTMITTRVNSTILTTQDTTQNSKFALVAVSLATSKIEQASKLAYDENPIDPAAPVTTALSTTLGPNSGETNEDDYDDCDDYNGYAKTDSSLQSAIFTIRGTVGYVQSATPDVITTTRTWNKKVTFTVTSISMRDTIRLSTICSYWNFR